MKMRRNKMIREEATHINYLVGEMLLILQREYPQDYQNGCFGNSAKISKVYGELMKQRKEIANYLISRME
jgi:hypothetical protein